jgi:hypothetical protein
MRRDHSVLAVALIGATLAALAHAEAASTTAASTKNRAAELRAVAIIAPPTSLHHLGT